MKIEVKGHSGCRIDVVPEDGELYIYKSTTDPKYLKRLALQAEKQRAAGEVQYQHIRVPKVYDLLQDDDATVIKMQYIYSKNFVEFFEQTGFEQVEYLIEALKCFIEYEVSRCRVETVDAAVFQYKYADVRSKCGDNPLCHGDSELNSLLDRCGDVFGGLEKLELPVGLCHGDLTFSNILFNGNNYYLIDFLDSFIETPLQDIVKIRQDTAFHWSQLMYTRRYDAVRLHIICDKIDSEIDSYFSGKYEWYRRYYSVMQLMNILRILPYAHESKVVEHLKKVLTELLSSMDGSVSIRREPVPDTADDSSKCSLIVPAAADKPEYENGLPYIFGLDQEGVVICLKSILGLDLRKFETIYFTILRKHDERFFISDILNLQFRRLGITNARVVVLDEPTVDQAETIHETILREQIEGSVFIKDADSYFTTEVGDADGVVIYPIEDLEVLSPRDKSYVAVDDMYYITNIIEKSVVGHFISAGGYRVSVSEFCSYYKRLRGLGRVYLSHVIYAMLLDKKTFRPMMGEGYKDWGTREFLRYSNE